MGTEFSVALPVICRPAVGQLVCQTLGFSLSLVSVVFCSTFPPLFYGHTSLFLCRLGPRVTALFSSPHSLFPHFTSDFAAFFFKNLLSLVSLRASCCFASSAPVSFSANIYAFSESLFIALSSVSAFISALIVVPCTAVDNEDILGWFVLEAGPVLQ